MPRLSRQLKLVVDQETYKTLEGRAAQEGSSIAFIARRLLRLGLEEEARRLATESRA